MTNLSPQTQSPTALEPGRSLPEASLIAKLHATKLQLNHMQRPFPFINVNTEISKYRGFPNTTRIDEYGPGQYRPLVVIHLPNEFEVALPKDIQQELITRDLMGKNKVDIFLNIQIGETPNEREIAKKGDESDFVLLAPHNWADPQMPNDFSGARLNSDFLVGIFDSDFDTSYEVPNGFLKSFNVYTHDSALSPRTRRIRVDPEKSQAFYSLVIGKIYPTNEERANVNLHVILNKKHTQALYDDYVKVVFSSDDGSKKREIPTGTYFFGMTNDEAKNFYDQLEADGIETSEVDTLIDTNVGEFLSRLNQDPTFKNTTMLNKINKLMGYTK